MAITTPAYTTRETIKRALDQGEVARNNRNIDRCIESASRNVELLCHRTFYPHIATKYFNWPGGQGAPPWRLWLDDNDLISLTAATSGGTNIPTGNVLLEPNTSGPPYTRVEIDVSTSSAFGGGSTHQRDIALSGLWGWNDDHYSSGATIEALDDSETTVDVDAAVAIQVGVGSILKIDDERLLVSERRQLDTGQVVGGTGLTPSKGDTTLSVTDGTAFEVDETLLLGAERALITEIAGNTLTIERAFEGSTSSTHPAGTAIYAPRTLVVERGALGSTAEAHTSGTPIQVWRVPAGLRQYVTAEAIHELMQEQTGWFRTMSASSIFGGTAKRAATVEALMDFRDQTYQTYGRKARTRAI
jgi:hypothetical protein